MSQARGLLMGQMRDRLMPVPSTIAHNLCAAIRVCDQTTRSITATSRWVCSSRSSSSSTPLFASHFLLLAHFVNLD